MHSKARARLKGGDMELDIRSNIRDFEKHLTEIQKKNLPYATMKAINATLGECRKDTINHIKATQKSSKAWWNNKSTGINREYAKKTHLRGTLSTGIYWARLAEEGGTKVPHQGHKNIAIPTDAVPKSRRKAGGVRTMGAQKKTFFTSKGLFRKKGGKRNRTIELLFSFAKSANIKPWLGFVATSNRTARREFPKQFARWLDRAVKTSK